MKHYLDIETGAIYQFSTRPTAKTKYRFIELDKEFLEKNAKVLREVTEELYTREEQNDKHKQNIKR